MTHIRPEGSFVALVTPMSLMRAIGPPSSPLRTPLNPFEGVRLQKGLDIVAQLGLDERYGYSLLPRSKVA